jgi:GNAT superfamily N-acetyltransferase
MHGSITITTRAMAAADARRVAELAGELGYPADAAQIEARFRGIEDNPDSRVFVAVDPDGEVWGWVHVFGHHLIVIEAGGHAEVGGLVVDARVRGRGIGKELMAAAEAWARERGYRQIALRSNTIRTEAHRFYQDLGYAIVKSQHKFQKALN